MWKNTEPDTPRMKWRRMVISRWIAKTKTHSEYAILIAFPLLKNGYANEPERYLDTYIAGLAAFYLGESTDI